MPRSGEPARERKRPILRKLLLVESPDPDRYNLMVETQSGQTLSKQIRHDQADALIRGLIELLGGL